MINIYDLTDEEMHNEATIMASLVDDMSEEELLCLINCLDNG